MSHGEPSGSSQEARHRHRVFIGRRLAVLCLFILLIAGVIGLVKAVFGSSGSTAAVVPPGGSVTTNGPNDSAAPTPGGVLLLGDSDAVGLASSLGRAMPGRTLTVVAKSASGLARPDFFDWPAAMRAAVKRSRPKVVVMVIGANDGQGLRNADRVWVVGHAPTTTDTAWKAEYAKRVAAAMDFLSADGRTVVWVGVANHPGRSTRMRLSVQDAVVRSAAAQRHGRVVYLDTWKLLNAPDGSYTTSVVDPDRKSTRLNSSH